MKTKECQPSIHPGKSFFFFFLLECFLGQFLGCFVFHSVTEQFVDKPDG